VPVPRRFDRQPPERDQTRINERIRVPEVRLIDEEGQQVGIIPTREALRIAQEKDLDLVEVAPEAKPPVCRILDYSKYKYEQIQKQKAARKHQQQINVREIKFRPKIAQHDYDTKKGHVMRFLKARDKVKVTIMFRGREMAHPERGEMILNRLAEELAELAVVEQRPQQDGRNMTMMLAPGRAATAETGGSDSGERNGGSGRSGGGSRRDREAAAKAEAAEPRPPRSEEPEAEAPEEPEAEASAEPAAEASAEPAAEAAAEPDAPPAEEGDDAPSAAAG
jgi:translation initiation factor IF-3